MKALTLLTLLAAASLTACGGGGSGNSPGAGKLHRDPAVASQQLFSADTRANLDHTLKQTIEKNRHEIALKQHELNERVAVFNAELQRDTASSRARTDELGVRERHQTTRQLGLTMSTLAALMVAFFLFLRHRGEEIAFKAMSAQNTFAIEKVCQMLPTLPPDVQTAILTNMTEKALTFRGVAK